MDSWKKVKISGVARIERCVEEFDVVELNKTPYYKFKVKIFEDAEGKFTGYTNLKVKDEYGEYYASVGYGNSIAEALKDTVEYFLKMLEWKDEWSENDFECCHLFDF